jgi:16S rRNA (uracil1498-N3)-methyltransferase
VLPRFFAPHIAASDALVALPEDESAHLARVLRLRPGDEIRVFDGRGGEWRAEVSSAGRARAVVKLLQSITPMTEPRIRIALATAVLKGDKMDDVVRDAVMLGFAAVQPIVTARSEVSLSALTRGDRHERWQRVAVSSAKQCGRATVPVVAPPIAFEGPASLAHLPSPLFLLVEPGASPASVTVAAVDAAPPAAATLVVGPEGGWAAPEVEQCAHHAHPLTLGTLTLRADSAATVAASALLAHWKLI